MRHLRRLAVLTVLAAAPILVLTHYGRGQIPGNLRIISPQNGAQITTDFVEVHYELLNPAVAISSTPTFQLQLDAGDPVRTESDNYTFTGLSPGKHTVLVQLVDANNTPVQGSANAVQFTVAPPAQPSGEPITPSEHQPQLAMASFSQSAPPANQALPNTNSALPLLSVIGFGVLLGGIVSALRTR